MAGRSWAAAGALKTAIAAASKTNRWRMILPVSRWARLARHFPRRVRQRANVTHSRTRSQTTAAHVLSLPLMVLAVALTGRAVLAQEIDRAAEYRQSAAVLA